MKTHMCIQGSDEWWELKRGVPSASNFDKIITSVKGEPSKSQKTFIADLLAERACMSPNYFSGRGISRPMQDGIDTEPEARAFYSLARKCNVQEVGFCTTDDGRFGCSPDGLVGEDGGLELKCPQLDTQFSYLMNDTLPSEYRPQVHGALIVTGRPWWDFLSYSPGADPLLIRVTPDDFTEKLRAALELFWAEYQKACARFLKRDPGQEG